MAMLTEEVGEVARIISRTYGEQSFRKKDLSKSLSEELADVLFVLICLANQTGTDLSKALEDNLTKKTKRDGKRHLSNAKLKKRQEPAAGGRT
jgi:NTP pyrophosphatase (non-canonical NTP hydrolase)